MKLLSQGKYRHNVNKFFQYCNIVLEKKAKSCIICMFAITNLLQDKKQVYNSKGKHLPSYKEGAIIYL